MKHYRYTFRQILRYTIILILHLNHMDYDTEVHFPNWRVENCKLISTVWFRMALIKLNKLISPQVYQVR